MMLILCFRMCVRASRGTHNATDFQVSFLYMEILGEINFTRTNYSIKLSAN